MAWLWVFYFNTQELKIWIREVGSDFKVDDVANVHGNTTTTSAPVTPNKCLAIYGHCRISEGVVKTSLT